MSEELGHNFTVLKIPEAFPPVDGLAAKTCDLTYDGVMALEGGRTMVKADNLRAIRMSVAYEARRKGKEVPSGDAGAPWRMSKALFVAIYQHASRKAFALPAGERAFYVELQSDGVTVTTFLVAALLDLHGATKVGIALLLDVYSALAEASQEAAGLKRTDAQHVFDFVNSILGYSAGDELVDAAAMVEEKPKQTERDMRLDERAF